MNVSQFLKFDPILKEKIWGGTKLVNLLGKKSNNTNLGESWEISAVDNNISIVSNGDLKGTNLKDLIASFKGDLLGDMVYRSFGEKFPLLIKFIDAKEALSIQLHPNDALAQKRHNSFGKTEMWYVMQADEKANLIVGFKKNVSKKEYRKHLAQKSLTEILNIDVVSSGDVYFIPSGRVHAIGAGVMLAEIQQTSDITYRVYDWDRKDTAGNYRDLHTNEAIDAINYSAKSSYKTKYSKIQNKASTLVICPYFTTNTLPVKGKILLNHSDKDSFIIYMCVKGKAIFSYKNHQEELAMGETLLVPAIFKEFFIESVEGAEVLEVYI